MEKLRGKSFIIVAFDNETTDGKGSSMEIVPKCWLISVDKTWWPGYIKTISRIAKLIADSVMPNEATWDQYPMRILGSSSKYLAMSMFLKTIYVNFFVGSIITVSCIIKL